MQNKYKNKILTIPNILSFFRIILIPFIVYFYRIRENSFLALTTLIISGLTDITDGFIARKFGMVSDFGKVFDPIADKLTQASVLYCLLSRFGYMIVPLIILIVKEIFTGITGLVSIKKTNTVSGADWHGKLTTVGLYSMMAIHLVWYNIPRTLSFILVTACIIIMVMSFLLYSIKNIRAIKEGSFK